MKKALFFLCSMLVLFASCSQDMPEIQDDAKQLTGMEDARERLFKIIANPAFRQMRANIDNPLGLAKIAKGTAYGREGQALTRAEEDSALYYVFNFDNGGYAVIGARPDMPELLAYAPGMGTGTVIGGDTTWIFNPPFIGGDDHSKDPIWYGDGSKVYDRNRIRYEMVTNPEYIDLHWNQYSFNSEIGGGDITTSTLTSAMAMFFGSDKYRPTYYGGYYFDWNVILTLKALNYSTNPSVKDEAKRQISRLMACICQPQNLAVTFGNPSTANPDNIPRTLRNFGFSNVGRTQNYNISDLKNELTQGYPVIMWGEDSQENKQHTWVCSGLCKQIIPWGIYTTKPTPDVAGEDVFYLYYYNANSPSFEDGWFIEQMFDMEKGPERYSHKKQGSNYKNNVKMHLGVRK